MNGRKLFREYAQSKGKEAKEFVKLDSFGRYASLFTKDNEGNVEELQLYFEDMVYWIIKTKKLV